MENCKAMKTNILKELSAFLIIVLCSVSANATIDSINVNQIIPEDTTSIVDSKVISKIIPVPGFDPDDPDPTPVRPKPDPVTPTPKPTPTPTNYDVGSPKGTFNVNSVGAATYDIEIDMPNCGSFSPQIGLSYSSQNGYGLAGYGFNITGISVISRAPKTLSQDGIIKGVSYSQGDAYCYNGKRLVLISGKEGCDGAVYSPVDNPHVRVVLHGNEPSSSTWFEVHDAQGIVSRFGYNDNARLLVSVKGYNRIMSWYVSSSEDKRGNCINYSYECSNYCMRPKRIEYGINKHKSRGITCAVDFSYEAMMASVSQFMVGTTTGSIDKRLAEITTSINSNVYRKYALCYDVTSDAGQTKFARLTKVFVCNGEGKYIKPIMIDWNYMPSCSVTEAESDYSTSNSDYLFEEENKCFTTSDLDNDGISDLIKISTGKGYTWYSGKDLHSDPYNAVKIFITLGDTKKLYREMKIDLPSNKVYANASFCLATQSIVDINGDGYNDIVLPYYFRGENVNGLYFYYILGKDYIAHKEPKGIYFNKDCDEPLIIPVSFTPNGKNGILALSNVSENSYYDAHLFSYISENGSVKHTDLKLQLSEKPKKVFTGDYNSDGLADLFVLCDKSYTIFYNQGGDESDIKISNSNKYVGSEFVDKWRVAQGDFDGDGRVDFVYPEGHDLNIAFNLGNGCFKISRKVATLELMDGDSNGDDDKYTLMAFDQDGDGKSDVFVSNAYYEYHGFPRWRYTFNHGCATWLYSTGNSLIPYKQVRIDRQEDLLQKHIFLGDFDGNGTLEMANYGGSLTGKSVSDYEKIRINATQEGNVAKYGKIKSITDGYGRITQINYLSGTNSSVYENIDDSQYPVVNCTLPVSLVSSVTVDGEAETKQTVNYKYAGMKIHLRGEGNLGFSKITNENISLGIKNETLIKQRDSKRFIPTEIETTSTIGRDINKSVTYIDVKELSHNNYFPYTYKEEVTDWYGNRVTTTTEYDLDSCLVNEQTISYGNADMYKKTIYSGYVKKSGVWRPENIENIQKHADDSSEFSLLTTYSYDDNGDAKEIVEASNTTKELKHIYYYDDFGNVVSSQDIGKDIQTITKHREYDESGRFVVKEYDSVTPEVHTYTYDIFGNLLTETDCSNTSKELTTTYTYDGWGNKKKTVDPLGQITNYTIGWGNSNSKKYYVETSSDNAPFTRTWYDVCGNKVLIETIGRCNREDNESYSYDEQGRVSEKVSNKGNLKITQKFTYDKHNRVLLEELSTGKKTQYSYGNRIVTQKEGERVWTNVYDAWGNVVRNEDPLSNIIEYTYNSNGKPNSVSVNGIITKFEYDEVGNQTAIIDPDAGRTEYTYAADGKILTQKDARGIETINTYDAVRRLVSSQVGNTLITHTYGTSGNSVMQLVKSEVDGNSVEYSYDQYGRKVRETRIVSGHGTYIFDYTYNTNGQLATTTYPGGLVVSYGYDKYGFHTSTSIGQDKIFSLLYDKGTADKFCFKNRICTYHSYDNNGLPRFFCICGQNESEGISTSYGNAIYNSVISLIEGKSGNLIHRQYSRVPQETYKYDELDRLIQVKSSSVVDMTYDKNGNIASKTGLGCYSYDASRPHAVVSVDNTSGIIPSATLLTSFNDINKISTIDGGDSGVMDFVYGPDEQRWYTELVKDDKVVRSTIYAGDYEKITVNDTIREFYYLDGNTIVIKQNGVFTPYVAFTDNQGSIISVFDENGTKVFNTSYDAWGKQTVKLNTIGLQRGYTGHEMINEFGIINMNGRIYDPELGRFFSPDNYVQAPDNSQSYNRYAYCLNNPLKYTDPSGDIWLALGAVFGGVCNWAFHGFQFNAKGLGYLATGALAGAIGAGVASGVNVAMAGGNFWLGAAELAEGVASTGFVAGAAAGASAGFASGLISATGNSWLAGESFGKGLLAGFGAGAKEALIGGITGGLIGGFEALNKEVNFFTGIGHFDMDGAMACKDCDLEDMVSSLKKKIKTIRGQYVGDFEGQNVFESKSLGTYSDKGGYSGFTLPDKGIFVGKGVFSGHSINGHAMMQHEFGHVLQYRKVGAILYYKSIAKESMFNCACDELLGTRSHDTFWTETWANYLSKNYFGSQWLGVETFSSDKWLRYYPSKDPSKLFKFIKFGWKGLFF